MKIEFFKYEGTGNDFILVDDRKKQLPLRNKTLIKKLCDRKFGIGADGLILLRKDRSADFKMIYFNSDGMESSMCGNGGRCIILFANRLGIIDLQCGFNAIDGFHEGHIHSTDSKKRTGLISLKMKDDCEIKKALGGFIADTGSPHYVKIVKNAKKVNVIKEGRSIRFSPAYKNDGINVNFLQKRNGRIFLRTYERGVEGETLSCGTGVVAAALASAFIGHKNSSNSCEVVTPGGKLKVNYKKGKEGRFSNVWLTGIAKMVFHGQVEV